MQIGKEVEVVDDGKPVDQVLPDEQWEFNEEVTRVFDDMLARSIPQYDVMRAAVFEMGRHFVQPHTDIVDLGASRGGAIAPFVDEFGALCHYRLIEVSDPMLVALHERFKLLEQSRVVTIHDMDLRAEYPPANSSLTICCLTLQFTPIEYRQQILRTIYEHTLFGGALILVEKVLGDTAEIDRNMIDIYYDMKRANGYTDDQIERKRLSLEGRLVPVTAAWNIDLLRRTGFQKIDCFWRWMNFAAWIAIKG